MCRTVRCGELDGIESEVLCCRSQAQEVLVLARTCATFTVGRWHVAKYYR